MSTSKTAGVVLGHTVQNKESISQCSEHTIQADKPEASPVRASACSILCSTVSVHVSESEVSERESGAVRERALSAERARESWGGGGGVRACGRVVGRGEESREEGKAARPGKAVCKDRELAPKIEHARAVLATLMVHIKGLDDTFTKKGADVLEPGAYMSELFEDWVSASVKDCKTRVKTAGYCAFDGCPYKNKNSMDVCYMHWEDSNFKSSKARGTNSLPVGYVLSVDGKLTVGDVGSGSHKGDGPFIPRRVTMNIGSVPLTGSVFNQPIATALGNLNLGQRTMLTVDLGAGVPTGHYNVVFPRAFNHYFEDLSSDTDNIIVSVYLDLAGSVSMLNSQQKLVLTPGNQYGGNVYHDQLNSRILLATGSFFNNGAPWDDGFSVPTVSSLIAPLVVEFGGSPVFNVFAIFTTASGAAGTASWTTWRTDPFCMILDQLVTPDPIHVEVDSMPLPPETVSHVSVVGISPLTAPLWVDFHQQPEPPVIEESKVREVDRARANRLQHALRGNTSVYDLYSSPELVETKQVFYSTVPELSGFDDLGMTSQMPEEVKKTNVQKKQPSSVPVELSPEFRVLKQLPDRVMQYIVFTIHGITVSNQYQPLWAGDDEPPAETEPCEGKNGSANSRSQNPIVAEPTTPKIKPKGQPPKVAKSVVQAAHSDRSVLLRLKQTVKTQRDMLRYALAKSASSRWLYKVAHCAFGADWVPDCWEGKIVQATILGHGAEQMHRILADEAVYRRLHVEVLFPSLFDRSYDWYEKCRVLEEEAARHNRDMHTLNGNVVTSVSMEDVTARPALAALVAVDGLEPITNPGAVAMTIGTLRSAANPLDLSTPYSQVLRGQGSYVGNGLDSDVALAVPDSLLYPRDLYDVINNVWVASGYRTSWLFATPLPLMGRQLEPTNIWEKVNEGIILQARNVGRADTRTINGFNANDTMDMGSQQCIYGLDMYPWVMKLMLLKHTMAWNADYNQLPLHGLGGVFDPYTAIKNNHSTLTVNDAALPFGEGFGGITSVFPFRGGASGQVAFHMCIGSVPDHRKRGAKYVPPVIFRNGRSPMLNLIIWMLGWTDYPAFSTTIELDVTHPLTGAQGSVKYVPFSSLVYLPGEIILDLVLPRRSPERDPVTSATALAMSMLSPISGPVATTGLPADTPLAICGTGPAQFHEYDLAELIVSYAALIDQLDVMSVLSSINSLVGIGEEVTRSFELMATLAVRYPALRTFQGLMDLPLGQVSLNAIGRTALQLQQDFPVDVAPGRDFVIGMTDSVAWNKLVFGYVAVAGSMPGSELPATFTDMRSLYWLTIQARMLAAVTCVHRAALGVTTTVWNGAYDAGANHQVGKLIRNHYLPTSGGNNQLVAPSMGVFQRRLYFGCTKFALSRLYYSSAATVYDIWCPPFIGQNIIAPINAAGASMDSMAPVFLCDTWIYAMLEQVPMSMSPYPLNNRADSTKGIPAGCVIALLNGFVGPFLINPRPLIPQTQIRQDTEAEMWNARLFPALDPTLATGYQMRIMSGVAVAQATGPVYQHTAVNDFAMAGALSATTVGKPYAWSTLWLARMGMTGSSIIPGSLQANMMAFGQISAGYRAGFVPQLMLNGLMPRTEFVTSPDEIDGSIWGQSMRIVVVAEAAKIKPVTPPVTGIGIALSKTLDSASVAPTPSNPLATGSTA